MDYRPYDDHEHHDNEPEPQAAQPVEPLAAPASAPAFRPVTPEAPAPALTAREHEASPAAPLANTSKRFLVAYLTTIFSSLSLLLSAIILGSAVFEHFFGPKEEGGFSFFDPAGFYVSIISSMIVFAVVYLVASRLVAKSAANDTVGLRDWRVYKLVYAIFAALLFAIAASVLAALVYIPIAQLTIADDLQPKQILVTVLSALHALVWIGLFLWQERLVKHGKTSILQGTIVVIAVLALIITTVVFPIGSKTNDRYDARTSNDLTTLETKIGTYKSSHDGQLPANLNALDLKDTAVANRLARYTYTQKESTASASNSLSDYSAYASLFSDMSESTTTGDELMQSGSATRSSYELCADFKTDTTDASKSSFLGALTGTSTSTSSLNSADFTTHKTGKVCFDRD